MKIIVDKTLKEIMDKVASRSDLSVIEVDGMPLCKMPMMNSDSSPYINTEEASNRGQEFMEVMVDSMRFND